MAFNLQYLITILQQILKPEQEHWILDHHSKPQLESLLEKAAALKQIDEKSSLPKVESLETQIRDAAHKAEDLIESHMVDQMLRLKGTRFTFVTPDLQEVTQELDSAMEQVVKLMAEHKISSTVNSSADDPLRGGASSSAESWNLLHRIVFGEEDCPDAFQGICREIAGDCRGLALSNLVRITGPLMRRGFFERIPNIKNLGVWFAELPSSTEVVDLTHLHELQTLRCGSRLNEDAGCRFLLQKLRFPASLRKLDLYRCVIFGRSMTSLCALPNLEVLRIGKCVFEDNEEWEAAEGDEFMSLQFLLLGSLKLVRWRADETNFPRLQELRIAYCPSLEEIPSGIGEIPTLQLIQLNNCSPSVVASAKQIQEQQQSEFDNYDLKLELYDD